MDIEILVLGSSPKWLASLVFIYAAGYNLTVFALFSTGMLPSWAGFPMASLFHAAFTYLNGICLPALAFLFLLFQLLMLHLTFLDSIFLF